jgi:uncharacterized membrane protein YccF (DUF307 family)
VADTGNIYARIIEAIWFVVKGIFFLVSHIHDAVTKTELLFFRSSLVARWVIAP